MTFDADTVPPVDPSDDTLEAIVDEAIRVLRTIPSFPDASIAAFRDGETDLPDFRVAS